jgi:hypothetical protein
MAWFRHGPCCDEESIDARFDGPDRITGDWPLTVWCAMCGTKWTLVPARRLARRPWTPIPAGWQAKRRPWLRPDPKLTLFVFPGRRDGPDGP